MTSPKMAEESSDAVLELPGPIGGPGGATAAEPPGGAEGAGPVYALPDAVPVW